MRKKTLVFGASLKTERYSNAAIHRLRNNHHEVFAFGWKPGEVLDVNINTELIPYKGIDTVTLYLNSKRQEAYYDYIIDLNPKRVIFNPGTENPVFYSRLKQHNIHVEVACTLVLLSTNQF